MLDSSERLFPHTEIRMNLPQLCQDTVRIVKETGSFLKKEVKAFDKARIEYKDSANNLVSYVDKEAERQLVSQLSQLLPEAGFITEEGTVTHRSETFNWVIDPLDGTTNFIHGLPIFCVSVGLIYENQPILGVVYEPNLDECFYTWQGGGAFCNETPIYTSTAPSLEHSLIATGFPYHVNGKLGVHMTILQDFVHHSHGIRRFGAAAVDLAYVACGRFEGFYEYNLKSWDMAAGVLLVQEAGGKVSDFNGGNTYLFGGKIVAGAAHIHTPMLDLINRHWE